MFESMCPAFCAKHFPAEMEEEFCTSMQESMPKMLVCMGAVAFLFMTLGMLGEGITNVELWHVPSVAAVFSFQIAAQGILMSLVFWSVVAQQQRVSRNTYESLMCIHASIYFAIPTLCDRWRVLRLFEDDMFKVFGQNYWDDTELTVGFAATMSAFFTCTNFRSSKSWTILVGGCLGYAFTTLALGSPENDPFKRTRLPNDVRRVIIISVLCFFSWYGSGKREAAMRQRFIDMRQVELRLAVTEKSLKTYVDAWVVLDGRRVAESSRIIDEMFGFKAEGHDLTGLLSQSDVQRFQTFLAEIQMSQGFQKINVSCTGRAGRNFEAELCGTFLCEGRTHVAVKQLMEDVFSHGGPGPDSILCVHEHKVCDEPESTHQLARTACDTMSIVSGVTGTSTQVFNVIASRIKTGCLKSADFESLIELGYKEHWLLDKDMIHIPCPATTLGKGGFGIVTLGSFLGAPVAVKAAHSNGEATRSKLPSLANELRILRHIRHPNIVMFHGVCVDSKNPMLDLVFEAICGTDLGEFISSEHGYNEKTARVHILIDICCALRYLHQAANIVHGDIKSSNIIVEMWRNYPRAKLLDMGLSIIMNEHAVLQGGTAKWCAPEVLRSNRVVPDKGIDVYAFGLLIHMLSTGWPPLHTWNKGSIITMAKANALPQPLWGTSAILDHTFRRLALLCSSRFPGCRPPIDEVHSELLNRTIAGSPPDTGYYVVQDCFSSATPQNDKNVCPVACWFDGASDLLDILDCTHTFRNWCGQVVDLTPLRSWIADLTAFTMWTNQCANRYAHRGVIPVDGLCVVLRPPSLYSQELELHAQCTVDMETSCIIGDEEYKASLPAQQQLMDPMIFRLVLYNIEIKALPAQPSTSLNVEL